MTLISEKQVEDKCIQFDFEFKVALKTFCRKQLAFEKKSGSICILCKGNKGIHLGNMLGILCDVFAEIALYGKVVS